MCSVSENGIGMDKWKSILLYGYSQYDLVKTKYAELLKAGYAVEGYIDQNAGEIVLEGNVPCWKLNELPIPVYERKRRLVIVLLQNAQKHEQIALQLQQAGFDYVLFLPRQFNTVEQKCIYEIYNKFLMGEFESLENVPVVDKVIGREHIPREYAVVTGKSMVVYLPIAIVFEYQQDENDSLRNIKYSRLYRQLYDYISGRRFECDDYLKFMGATTSEQKNRLLSDRCQLFYRFEHENNIGSEYFVQSAAIARWNTEGYFNIIDGHHRVTYLAYKGYSFVPVRISMADYSCWENNCGLSQADVQKIKQHASCPVWLPRFLEEHIWHMPLWNQVADYMWIHFFSKVAQKLLFLETDSYHGYFARFCALQNWTQSIIGLWKENDKSMCAMLNKACDQGEIKIIDFGERILVDVHIIYVDTRELTVQQFAELIARTKCRAVIAEICVQSTEYFAVIENLFASKVDWIGWADCCNNVGIYGIGDGSWQN